jgi:hypothetical protein
MGKAGEKQKNRPKIKDKKQSEQFREAARALGADESSDAFDRIVARMGQRSETDPMPTDDPEALLEWGKRNIQKN